MLQHFALSRLALLIGALFALASGPFASLTNAQPVVLQWKWNPGDERRYVIESTFLQKVQYDRSATVPGQPQDPATPARRPGNQPSGPDPDQDRTVHCTQIFHVVERVVDVDDAGIATVTRTFERVQVQGTDDGPSVTEVFEYDSAKPDASAPASTSPVAPRPTPLPQRQSPRQRLQAPPPDPGTLPRPEMTVPGSRDAPDHPLIQPFAALAGRTITYRIDPEGRVLSCEGGVEAMNDVFSFLNGDSPMGMVGALFSASLTNERLAEQCQQGLSIIPNAAVRRGDTWSMTLQQTLPLVGSLRSDITCRLAGIRGRAPSQVATIENRGEMALEGGESGPGGLGGLFQVNLNTSSMDGTMEFDAGGGFVRSQRQRMLSEWEIYAPDLENADRMGAPMKIIQRIEQDMSMCLEP